MDNNNGERDSNDRPAGAKENDVRPAVDSDRRRARPDWLLSARPLSLVRRASSPSASSSHSQSPTPASTRWRGAHEPHTRENDSKKRGRRARQTRSTGPLFPPRFLSSVSNNLFIPSQLLALHANTFCPPSDFLRYIFFFSRESALKNFEMIFRIRWGNRVLIKIF